MVSSKPSQKQLDFMQMMSNERRRRYQREVRSVELRKIAERKAKAEARKIMMEVMLKRYVAAARTPQERQAYRAALARSRASNRKTPRVPAKPFGVGAGMGFFSAKKK
jgi:hypothetical protein